MPNKNARTWSITVNNPPVDVADDDMVEAYVKDIHTRLGARYTCGQIEKGENGTFHA